MGANSEYARWTFWIRWAVALVCALVTGGLVASLQRTRLEFLSQRFESELLSTEKVVRLLSRTTVIENGIRFGSGQMVEAVLNHCIRGETQIAALAVWDIQSGNLLSNTVSPTGLFTGAPEFLSHLKAPIHAGFHTEWLSLPKAQNEASSLVVFALPVEQEDEPVGVLAAYVDVAGVLNKAEPGASAVALVGSEPGGALSISQPLGRIRPTVYLRVPASQWLPWALVSAVLCATFAHLLFWRIEFWSRKRREKQRARDALYDQALQVTHDIRSPVSALWSILPRTDFREKADRELFTECVRRMHQIAEDLLAKYRRQDSNPGFAHLGHAVLQAVAECRAAESQRRPTLRVVFPDLLKWSTCVALDPEVARRALVILVQNAIEAAESRSPLVEIGWQVQGNLVDLWIWHNGKLGGKKLTSHGLGTRYLQTVFGVAPQPRAVVRGARSGIEVHLLLQRRIPEVDFADRILIATHQPLIVLDDDATVFARVKERVRGSNALYFATGKQQLEEVLIQSGTNGVFLVDFRLAPNEFSGPEVLQQSGARGPSYLVTSFPEDPGVLIASARWSMPIVAKSTLTEIPFVEQSQAAAFVLLDDDLLTRRSWEISAASRGIRLKAFADLDEATLREIENADACFVDGGLLVAKPDALDILAAHGPHQIFITTGAPERAVPFLSRVHGVLNKRPPWDNPDFCFQFNSSVS
jgi:signal transduction histidine kinase